MMKDSDDHKHTYGFSHDRFSHVVRKGSRAISRRVGGSYGGCRWLAVVGQVSGQDVGHSSGVSGRGGGSAVAGRSRHRLATIAR